MCLYKRGLKPLRRQVVLTFVCALHRDREKRGKTHTWVGRLIIQYFVTTENLYVSLDPLACTLLLPLMVVVDIYYVLLILVIE